MTSPAAMSEESGPCEWIFAPVTGGHDETKVHRRDETLCGLWAPTRLGCGSSGQLAECMLAPHNDRRSSQACLVTTPLTP